MNVGLYFDLRNPPEWATDFGRLYGFTLEMCEEAEHLGCHSIWLSEHHRFDDGYLPQPLTLAAAVAARTRVVRASARRSSSRRSTIRPSSPSRRRSSTSSAAAASSSGLGAGYRVPEFELYGADSGQPLRRRPTAGRGRFAACGTRASSRPARCRSGCRSGWATRGRRERGEPGCWARAC